MPLSLAWLCQMTFLNFDSVNDIAKFWLRGVETRPSQSLLVSSIYPSIYSSICPFTISALSLQTYLYLVSKQCWMIEKQSEGRLKGLSSRLVQLKVVIIDEYLLKGEAPRFSADFAHLLSWERPFKFQHHLIQDFECDKLISSYCIYLW